MKSAPKTIQIFLPSGDPHGIRSAEITTRIVQLIEVPRSLLKDFLEMPECEQVAVYFLVSQQNESSEARVYVGQTGDLRARLTKHSQTKEFWERALVLVSKTNSLTQTHALFLEWHCIQEARRAGRYADENGNSGSRPHTPPPLEADCLEIFETGRTLLASLGHPLFDSVASVVETEAHERLLYCTAGGAEGRGLYTPEGFVVLKGSRGRKSTGTITATKQRFLDRLVEAGAMHVEGDAVLFDRDHLFGSPSMAAFALLGRNSNGWKEWKNERGFTLDELERNGMEGE